MWDSVASSNDGDLAMGALERERERECVCVCVFLKFGQTEDRRIEKGNRKGESCGSLTFLI